MKIRYLASGEIGHERNDIAAALVRAGVAEAIGESPDEKASRLPRPGDAVIPQPSWQIVTVKYDDGQTPNKQVLAIRMNIGSSFVHFSGLPEKVNAVRTWPGGFQYLSGFGREVPEEICKQYKRQWNANEHLRLPSAVLYPERSVANDAMTLNKADFDRKVAAGEVPYFPQT